MTITLAGVARDAGIRWRRDRALLLALAGPFLFLPLFAWLLLATPPVAPPGSSDADQMRTMIDWAGQNLHWLALRVGLELYGSLAILALYLSRRHRDVAGLLRLALTTLPGFIVAVVGSWGLITLGVLAFIVPGLYVYGRVCLTGAVLVAEPETGIAGAITRSVALTHGRGWQLFAYLSLTLVAGLVAVQLIGGVADALKAARADNPVAVVILNGLAAAAVTATTVARLLLQVALYRRLARPRHGV